MLYDVEALDSTVFVLVVLSLVFLGLLATTKRDDPANRVFIAQFRTIPHRVQVVSRGHPPLARIDSTRSGRFAGPNLSAERAHGPDRMAGTVSIAEGNRLRFARLGNPDYGHLLA